jgi:hypothetical protein
VKELLPTLHRLLDLVARRDDRVRSPVGYLRVLRCVRVDPAIIDPVVAAVRLPSDHHARDLDCATRSVTSSIPSLDDLRIDREDDDARRRWPWGPHHADYVLGRISA